MIYKSSACIAGGVSHKSVTTSPALLLCEKFTAPKVAPNSIDFLCPAVGVLHMETTNVHSPGMKKGKEERNGMVVEGISAPFISFLLAVTLPVQPFPCRYQIIIKILKASDEGLIRHQRLRLRQ